MNVREVAEKYVWSSSWYTLILRAGLPTEATVDATSVRIFDTTASAPGPCPVAVPSSRSCAYVPFRSFAAGSTRVGTLTAVRPATSPPVSSAATTRSGL